MKLRRHIPEFIEHEPQPVTTVSDLEELLALEWIVPFKNEPGFHRFSIARDYYPESQAYLLIAEYQDGKRWFVLANLYGDIRPLASIPDFKPDFS